jgi:5-methylcytosine-specific restriction endonuclease McrA
MCDYTPSKQTTGTKQMAKIRNRATREIVMTEYNHCCAVCGCADHRSLHIDHAISQDHGGADTVDNLQVLCNVCNSLIKGNIDTPKMKPRRREYDCRRWERPRRAFQAEINGLRTRARRK